MKTKVVRQRSITSKKGKPIHLSVDDFDFQEEDFVDKQFIIENSDESIYEYALQISLSRLEIGEISAWMLPVGYTSNGIDYGFYEETIKLKNDAFRFHYQWFTHNELDLKKGLKTVFKSDFISQKGNAVKLKTPFLDVYDFLVFKIDKGKQEHQKKNEYLTYIPMYELGKNYEIVLPQAFKSKDKEYFLWMYVSGGMGKGSFKIVYEWLIKS